MLAALASTQLPAATDAVRHNGSGLTPVRGSMMWWVQPDLAESRPVRQRRATVDEVANPPEVIETCWWVADPAR